MPTIGFTGTREDLTPRQTSALAQHLSERRQRLGVFIARHGLCVGADVVFNAFVSTFENVEIHAHPGMPVGSKLRAPDWPPHLIIHELEPPLERNKIIVEMSTEMVACPKEMEEQLRSGTWATIRYARGLKRPLAIIWNDGSKTEENQP
jgi:hypothetical protein